LGLKGTLTELALTDLIEVTSLGGKCGQLRVTQPDGTLAGVLSFRDGRLINAECGSLHGERAFYRLLALREGAFEFDTEADPGPENLDLPTASLLMEGMRRLDEIAHLRALLPATARVALVGGEAQDAVEGAILGYLGPGERDVGDIVAGALLDGVADEYEVLGALARLRERGIVRVSA